MKMTWSYLLVQTKSCPFRIALQGTRRSLTFEVGRAFSAQAANMKQAFANPWGFTLGTRRS